MLCDLLVIIFITINNKMLLILIININVNCIIRSVKIRFDFFFLNQVKWALKVTGMYFSILNTLRVYHRTNVPYVWNLFKNTDT